MVLSKRKGRELARGNAAALAATILATSPRGNGSHWLRCIWQRAVHRDGKGYELGDSGPPTGFGDGHSLFLLPKLRAVHSLASGPSRDLRSAAFGYSGAGGGVGSGRSYRVLCVPAMRDRLGRLPNHVPEYSEGTLS